MEINKVQNHNQTNFGIKYINKQTWNKDVLKAFEKSKILKEINDNYPKANVKMLKISGEESIANAEILHTLIMDIELTKNKLFRWHLSSHAENVPEKNLIKDLETLTLNQVEESSVEKLSPVLSISINYKQNPIKAFLQKIFS